MMQPSVKLPSLRREKSVECLISKESYFSLAMYARGKDPEYAPEYHREESSDNAVLALDVEEKTVTGFYAVCDGIGSSGNLGQHAANRVCEILEELCKDLPVTFENTHLAEAYIRKHILISLFKRIQSEELKAHTTLHFGMLSKDSQGKNLLTVANIGDSFGLLIRGDKVIRLSKEDGGVNYILQFFPNCAEKIREAYDSCTSTGDLADRLGKIEELKHGFQKPKLRDTKIPCWLSKYNSEADFKKVFPKGYVLRTFLEKVYGIKINFDGRGRSRLEFITNNGNKFLTLASQIFSISSMVTRDLAKLGSSNVGSFAKQTPCTSFSLEEGDQVIFASDGLTLNTADIVRVLKCPVEQAAGKLVDAAVKQANWLTGNGRGSGDDVTVGVLRIP